MKILIYSFTYSPTIGGVENVLLNLVSGLSKTHKVKVITAYNPNQIKTNSLIKKLQNYLKISNKRKEDKQIVECFMSIPRSIVGFLLFPFRFILGSLTVIDEINNFNPDIINYHFPNDNIYQFFLIQKFLKPTTILNIHGNEIHKFSKNKIYKLLLSNIIKSSKKVVVNSEFMKKEVIKTYKKANNKIVIIKNGIDKNQPKVNTKLAPEKDSYYLYVGRFDYKKNLELLINTFNKFAASSQKKLIIIGDGEGKYSKENLSKLATTNKITFLGKLPNKKVHSYFTNAYYSIFPSHYEPFGIVALESLQASTPIIVSSGSGLEEIVNNTKAGVIFENNSEKDLLNTLLKADKNPQEKNNLLLNAEKNISNYYWNNIIKEYEKVYSN